MSRTAKVACVTGAGTAPELMAEAVLALDAIARLHGLEIDETHVTFGAVAVARAGHAVPALTRAAILAADAVLVAGAEEPALAEIMSELDLRAQVTRVRFGQRDDVAFVSPLAEGSRRSGRSKPRFGSPSRERCVSLRSATLRGTISWMRSRRTTSTCRSSISRRSSRFRWRRSTRAGSTSPSSHSRGRRRWWRSQRRRRRRASRRTGCWRSTGRACSCRRPTAGSPSPAAASSTRAACCSRPR